MSTSYNAYLVVGLDYDKLKLSPAYIDQNPKNAPDEDFNDWAEELWKKEIWRHAPYYDAASEESFYGLQCNVDGKTPEEIAEVIASTAKKFKDVTGLNGEVRVILDVM